jgi:hypothetical protein
MADQCQHNLLRLDRLRQAISQAADDTASLGQSIPEAIRRFGKGRAELDDISLLCLGRAVPQVTHKRKR